MSRVLSSIKVQSTLEDKCKVEATGNKLDIMPDEKIMLNVFIPIQNYKDNKKIDSDEPQYEISGYLNEVTAMNHFVQSGDFLK